MSLRLRLFGAPSLTDRAGRTPTGLGPGKPLAVLCYLAREGEARRETVTELLWGSAPESKARNAFRQALHRLRAALGEDVIPRDPDTVRIAATADLVVDVAEFERALSEGRPEDAVELVTGDFLDGFTLGEPGFDHWADGQRARLRIRFLGALRDAARGALAAGRLDDAVRHAARLAQADPLDSSSALLEARALTAAGRGLEALSLLRDHAARFREEVGEEPPEEVAAAVDGLAREGEGDEGHEGDAGDASRVHGSERGPATAGAGGAVGAAGLPDAARAGGQAAQEGRPEVLGRLLAAWRSATAEECSVVVLEGAAGAGKSWLIDELVRRVKPLDQPLVLRGAERMGAHGLPYAPVAEALRGVLRARGLAGASTHLLAEAARLVPELRDRFDLPTVTPVADRTERLRFYEGVASVVDAVAYEQPVLMALEGVHESDEWTLELVHFLATRLGDARVLFVLSGEPGRALTGLARRLGERAERVVLEPPAAVPVVLEDVVRPRIEALSPRERRVLTLLALVQRPLPVRLLAACTHLPDGAVVEVVESLERSGLARDGERGVIVADERVAELARSGTGPAARSLLAGWAAEALAADRAATDAELAELSALAGRHDAAARYAEAAARTAVALGARDVAADRLRQALEWTTDPSVRARLERLLATLGDRPRWLGAGRSVPGAARRPPLRTRVMVLGAAAVVVLALVAVTRTEPPGVRADLPGRVVRDTLVLVRTEPDGSRIRLGFTGVPEDAATSRPLVLGTGDLPRWVAALHAADVPALPSPDGQHVAIDLAVAGGHRLVAVSVDRADTLILAAGARAHTPLAWSPDGARLLYRTGRADEPGDLWATGPPGPDARRVPIDTSSARSVHEAAWSPDGIRVAWTAGPAQGGNRRVYVAFTDGTEPRLLTASAPDGDAHDLTWAPGGERVAFTSDRPGSTDVFAVEILSGRLWRLTWDDAHDARPAFSPDGSFLAFESTRGGEAAVYVMSSWGGEPIRISGPGQRVAHDGWRGYPPPTLSHLRFPTPAPLEPGQAARLVVEPVFDDYVARHRGFVRWQALDPAIIDLAGSGPDDAVARAAAADTFVVAHRPGLGRVAVSAGGWRADTLWVKVGTTPVEVWSAHEPRTGTSPECFPLGYGLDAVAWLDPDHGATTLALVPPGAGAADPSGRTLWLASLTWNPASAQATYRVEREEFTDRIRTNDSAAPGTMGIRVEDDGRVSFLADGAPRWTSTLRVTGGGSHNHRARLRLEGAGDPVATRVTVTVGGVDRP